MRHVSLLAVLASSVSLAACGGGGGSSSLLSSASSLSVCGVNCPQPTGGTGTGTGTGTSTGTSTGTGTGTGTGTSTGVGTGTTNVGNATSLSTGDTTLILESSKLKSTIATPGLSKLTVSTSPSTAIFEIDTKTANKAAWPIPKTMKEYVYGSTYVEPIIPLRHLGADDPTWGGTGYKEYRALSYNADGSSADEELQVWNWKNSYATQYRDITAGGEAGHQAWSFGGTKTAAAAMPTSGVVNYTGNYTATAKTWNFVDDPSSGQTVSHNNLWRVYGDATATANFGTGAFQADLAPKIWMGWASLNSATGFWAINADPTNTIYNPATKTFTATPRVDPNWANFMNVHTFLDGTITSNAPVASATPGGPTTPATTGAATGNNATDSNYIIGTATMDSTTGWVTNETVNPFYAAFFGANADEVTGVFNLEAVNPDPTGGDISINDDRRGFITMSGLFHVHR